MGRVERFSKRKKVRHEIDVRHGLSIAADQSLVNEFLNSEIDLQAIEKIDEMLNIEFGFEFNIEVSDQEVNDLLQTLEKGYNDQVFDEVIRACKNDTLRSIIGPFGLGGLVAKFDKEGGNVTTVRNAQDKVYARKQDEYDRIQYTHSKNIDGKAFAGGGKGSAGSEFTRSQLDQKQSVIDAYTGKSELGSNTSPDHVESISRFHKDGGFMLPSEKKADFATDKDNLALTRRDINKSMRDQDKIKWTDAKQNGREETNAEYFEVNRELVKEKYDKGKETAKKHAPGVVDKTKYYGENIIGTGLHEGAKLGVQQALGLVLCEFFIAVFDELHDIYDNGFAYGFDDGRFLQILKKRLSNIAKRVAARWEDARNAFTGGFLSGFLSNLVTVVINMFVRTGKRMVRIIREGLFSILKALKLVCFPPESMTFLQAAHEASKLIAVGLTVVGGIVIEQQIDNLIKATPVLEAFSDILTVVLIGGLTGISTTFIVYAIDKLDVFRVNDGKKHVHVMNSLETGLEQMFSEGDLLIEQLTFNS